MPRLGSRVRIPSPAPNFPNTFNRLRLERFRALCFAIFRESGKSKQIESEISCNRRGKASQIATVLALLPIHRGADPDSREMSLASPSNQLQLLLLRDYACKSSPAGPFRRLPCRGQLRISDASRGGAKHRAVSRRHVAAVLRLASTCRRRDESLGWLLCPLVDRVRSLLVKAFRQLFGPNCRI